jgi:hypothetical protein
VSDQPRVKTGQYTFAEHKEPDLKLDSPGRAERLRELAKPLSYPVGSRAMTGGEFGTIVEVPGRKGHLTLKLDGSGSIVTKPQNVVPWDAHLDMVMPAVSHNPDPETDVLLQEDADRALRHGLVRMRNALESASSSGDTYYQGIAYGEAEVAAALENSDADPDMIGDARNELLKLGLPLGADHKALSASAIRQRTAAPLTMLRARRLAGYFTTRAVEMQSHNGALPQRDWGTDEWTKQGALHAYSKAAVRFAAALPHTEDRYPETRFTRLLADGETNADTIIGETFDDGAW